MTEKLKRIVALRLASEAMGQAALAEALGVADRTLRSYLGVERGIADEVLELAAAAVEAKAAELGALAERLRGLTA